MNGVSILILVLFSYIFMINPELLIVPREKLSSMTTSELAQYRRQMRRVGSGVVIMLVLALLGRIVQW